MERKIITETELIEWMNNELHKEEGFKDCRFTSVLRLADKDEGGCNWSDPNIRCSGTEVDICQKRVFQIVSNARKLFNIKLLFGNNQLKMERRLLYTPIFHIDTNLINARGNLATMNQIEKWAIDGVILVNMSNVSFNEAKQGGNVQRIKKALSHIFTLVDENCNELDPKFQQIAIALFPTGIKAEKERNDVRIVWEAAKWHAILVTNDGGSKNQPGGILGNAYKINNIVNIMCDTEAVEFIKSKINERDDRNIEISNLTDQALPEWTGKD
jgi:hypothetical protein